MLASALARLVQLCQTNFQIQLSQSQLELNREYRETVIAELSELEDPQLSSLLAEISQLSATSVTKAVSAAEDSKQPAIKGRKSILWPAVILLIGLAGAGGWFISTANHSALSVAATTGDTAANAAADDKSTNGVASQSPTTLQPIIRLHGSNTVGEKLAPVLLEAFLTQQGGSAFSWQQQSSETERRVTFIDAGKTNTVQLHAHGSSTAFKDLLAGKADIGMSSRRISSDEVTQGISKLGDLSKIGNEHIIALDGLAVIVNQNNTLKSISTEVLSKVFAGEITRWSQLGGADKPIVVLARDDNSGTFDTFNSLVLKKFDKTLTDQARRFESSTELSVAVAQDETAIGFIGLDFISYNKALAISEGADTAPIYPTRFTISTEDYALSRRLYLYTPTSASQTAKDFAQFAISEQGQALVEQTGLISQNIKVEKTFAIDDAPASYNRYVETGQRLSLNFRFNQGENDLDNKGKRDLERLIRFMEQNSGRRLVLMGFSDAVGAEETNTDLAMRRAKVIERELVSRGIPVMAVESYGEMLPIANNDSDTGRERNRRVEVWVI
ncbi:cell envelope biogenesis protein OmpA [Rheinheimera riviphila]|uniref:Cell envelope biogenesis protein OmpA n=1 Tax=Rheinheimera riviphila TaxID=1834037 RepID=A0A437R2H2_9GAMM|nr:cell envelope biogenesis protein OmpA [Rheinheimera riviphila]